MIAQPLFRNPLFFKEEVSREALQAAWDRYKNNPVARGGVWAGVLGLLIPGVCFAALVCGIIGLRQVNPRAHPPIGRRRQAIAGIVLGVLGLGTTGLWVVFVLLGTGL